MSIMHIKGSDKSCNKETALTFFNQLFLMNKIMEDSFLEKYI